jgi:4-amino-4-deoxy-L-arabinose transferase-like glycosyltransferase
LLGSRLFKDQKVGATAISTASKEDIAFQSLERAKSWPSLLTILVVSSCTFFFRLGNFGVIDGSESYYPAAVREMVEAHSYLIPQMNYQVYFSKPIMTFWLLSAAYHMFGVNEFAGRFFGALFGVLVSLAIYAVTRAIAGNRAALLAGLFFAGSPFVLEYFRASSVDAFFTTFLALAFCAFLAVVSAGRLRWWPAIYVALGCAALTKGPAGLVLFGAGAAFSLLALRPRWATIKFWLSALHPFKGVALLLAVAAPWYVAVGLATKWLFLKVFFVYENIGRFNGHTNAHPVYWWRYPLVVLAGLLPWSLFVPALVTDAVKAVFAKTSARGVGSASLVASTSSWSNNVDAGQEPGAPQGARSMHLQQLQQSDTAGSVTDRNETASKSLLLDAKLVSVSFAAAVIILFSMSKTQMEPYILPAVTPLAIAAALYAEQWSKATKGFGLWTMQKCSVLATFAGPILATAATVAAFVFKDHAFPMWARIVIPATAWMTAAFWIWQRRLVRNHRLMDAALAIAVASSLLFGTIVAGVIEYVYNKKFADLHYLCGVVRTQTNGEVGLFGNYYPSVFYYVQRPVNCFYQAHWLEKRPGANNYVYVLCRNNDLPRLQNESGVTLTPYLVRGEWGLYKADNAYLEPYATLSKTFTTLSIPDIISDRYHLGVLTDCLSGGPLWKGK